MRSFSSQAPSEDLHPPHESDNLVQLGETVSALDIPIIKRGLCLAAVSLHVLEIKDSFCFFWRP